MKTVQTIIDLLGGLARLRTHPIKIDVEGFMPLSIEFIGTGPRGFGHARLRAARRPYAGSRDGI